MNSTIVELKKAASNEHADAGGRLGGEEVSNGNVFPTAVRGTNANTDRAALVVPVTSLNPRNQSLDQPFSLFIISTSETQQRGVGEKVGSLSSSSDASSFEIFRN